MSSSTVPAVPSQVLLFTLSAVDGSEVLFGLPFPALREIVNKPRMVRLPLASEQMPGLACVHERLIPVLRLSKLATDFLAPSSCLLLVVEQGAHQLALEVQTVTSIADVPQDFCQALPDAYAGVPTLGTFLVDGVPCAVLDLPELITHCRSPSEKEAVLPVLRPQRPSAREEAQVAAI